MKVLDSGHVYELDQLDNHPLANNPTVLVFVKREGPGFPGNVGHYTGTNCQEVLRALIDRVKYLNNQIPDVRNQFILNDLRHAIWMFEQRAAERHGRDWGIGDNLNRIEELPTCPKCRHIGCEGQCHP